MTRIAVIADHHFDRGSRWDECVRIHDWIADDMDARGVDLCLSAGDVYERRSTPEERQAVAAWCQRVTERRPLVIVRGNHDAPGDLALLERLESRYPIDVVEDARVVTQAGIAIACLAWPRKASIGALAGAMGCESSLELAGDLMRDVLRGLGAQGRGLRAVGPTIFLGHVMVSGSMTSRGQPLVGCDMELGLEDLGLVGADAYVIGHIHMPQDWTVDGAPIIYPGSPRRTAYGEVEEKGYVILDVDANGVRWERVPTPAAPMYLLEDEWGTDVDGTTGFLVGLNGEPSRDEDYRGAEVRLRYSVDADQREPARAAAAKIEAWLRSLGAVDVKLDPVVRATTRARAPEVGAATDLPSKLRALWRARNEDLGDRAQRLTGRAVTLEEEVRHAV